MRRYDDLVEVRKGMVATSRGPVEGPEQFLWKGRLWKVHDVLAHWVETGPWWRTAAVAAVLGAEEVAPDSGPATSTTTSTATATVHDLLAERDVWRVEAGRGLAATGAGRGVFDLVFDWGQGCWLLSRCLD